MPPLTKLPAGMSAAPALPMEVLVQLIWLNGMLLAPLVNPAGVVTCNTAVTALAAGRRKNPPT